MKVDCSSPHSVPLFCDVGLRQSEHIACKNGCPFCLRQTPFRSQHTPEMRNIGPKALLQFPSVVRHGGLQVRYLILPQLEIVGDFPQNPLRVNPRVARRLTRRCHSCGCARCHSSIHRYFSCPFGHYSFPFYSTWKAWREHIGEPKCTNNYMRFFTKNQILLQCFFKKAIIANIYDLSCILKSFIYYKIYIYTLMYFYERHHSKI